MNAVFYRFSKRRNSTKIPGQGVQSTTYSIRFNDGQSSILSPVIKLSSATPMTNLVNYNYCYISELGRYYYVDDWRFDGDGCWTAFCSVDALASWRSYINATSGYTHRVFFRQDSNLLDPVLVPTQYFVTVRQDVPTYMTTNLARGTFILGVISKNSPNVGAVTYYKVTASALETLVSNMMSNTSSNWADVSNIDSDVLKSLVDPMQYIVSCKWFPFDMSITGTIETIYLGGWSSRASGTKLGTTYLNLITRTLNLNELDDVYGNTITLSEYPRFAPFAEYTLITPWGTFELDPTVMGAVYNNFRVLSSRILYLYFTADLVGGNATLRVSTVVPTPDSSAGLECEMIRRDIPFAMDIPLAQVSLNYLGIAQSGLSAAASAGNVGAWMTNPVGNAANIAGDLLNAAAASLSPAVSSTAGGSAFTPIIETMTYQMRRFKSIAPPNTSLCGGIWKRNISALSDLTEGGTAYSGYLEMSFVNFEAPCRPAEYETIVDALMNGIYIE